MRIDFSNHKNVALNSWNLIEIHQTEIELKEIIGELFHELHSTSLSFRKSEIKGDLGIATTIQDICKERKGLVNNANIKLDARFRAIAKKVLINTVYNQITKMAKVVDEAPPQNVTVSQMRPEYQDLEQENVN
jgi:hypothetical protein